MKWTTMQPKYSGVYLRATINGDLLGAYQMTGTDIDPCGPSQWYGPLPRPPSWHHEERLGNSLSGGSVTIRTALPWNDVRVFEPSNHQMCLIVTPTSQRGSIDYGFKDMKDGKWKVQSMIGWEPVSDFGGEVTHWYPLRDFDLPASTHNTEA